MLTRENALTILGKENTPPNVIEHCKAVADYALEFAEKIKANGHEVDLLLVETGALLHDIGRSQANGIGHGYTGGVILRRHGLEQLAKIAECHVGAGITKHEAAENGMPPKDLIPKTIEEKIIANADNLMDGTHRVSISSALNHFRGRGMPEESIERVSGLYHEIEALASST